MLGFFKRTPPPSSEFLGRRVGYAVGDIHGCTDLLALLLNEIEARAEADTREGGPPIVVFLGDYVDRGPDSKGTLDLLLSGRPNGCERRYLRGNHEQSMMAFMDDPIANRAWMLQGGAETLLSYDIQPPPVVGGADHEWIGAGQLLRARLPAAHFEFLSTLERFVVLGDYLFVHAGVNAARPLEDQTDEDLYWSRAAFIGSKRRFSHRVVHGHTPVDVPFADERRVAVDTGAYASGVLSAARFEGGDVSFLSVSSRPEQAAGLQVRPVTAADVDWG
ncbi:MAG: metallophosphoesterase family protein [Hyphomonadaceae bacterium]